MPGANVMWGYAIEADLLWWQCCHAGCFTAIVPSSLPLCDASGGGEGVLSYRVLPGEENRGGGQGFGLREMCQGACCVLPRDHVIVTVIPLRSWCALGEGGLAVPHHI